MRGLMGLEGKVYVLRPYLEWVQRELLVCPVGDDSSGVEGGDVCVDVVYKSRCFVTL